MLTPLSALAPSSIPISRQSRSLNDGIVALLQLASKGTPLPTGHELEEGSWIDRNSIVIGEKSALPLLEEDQIKMATQAMKSARVPYRTGLMTVTSSGYPIHTPSAV